MTFTHYWAILLKRWEIVVCCFIFVGLGSYIVSRLMTPLYQSSVVVQVAIQSGSNQGDYNSLLASNQLVQTESDLAISSPVLRAVASHYPGMTADQLSKNATSSIKLNTQLFEIDAQDPDPAQAAAIANDIAATLIQQQLQLAQQDNQRSQQQIQQDLDSTGQKIDSTTSQVGQLQAQENALLNTQQQAEIQAQKLNLLFQPGPEQLKQEADLHSQIAVLQTQLTRLQNKYNQWQTALAQLELTQAQSGSFLRVVQSATVNTNPERPQILLNTALGLLVGLLLGIMLAMLFEQLDMSVGAAEALTQLLGWPVLATIWQSDSMNPKGQHINVESYRALRTNIGFSVVDKQLHTMVVASAAPHEGKSVIAANLAIFMAKAGKNTLLIDADLRHPTIHEKFGLPGDRLGFTNAIMAISQLQFLSPTSSLGQPNILSFSGFSLDSYIHSVAVPNLQVMPSGPLPPNPSELLDSKAMKRLFAVLKTCRAEIVVFDTPPLLGLSDASILASVVDGIILVVDAKRNRKKNLQQAKALLEKAGARVLGCVMNKQQLNRREAAHHYYRTEEQSAGVGANL